MSYGKYEKMHISEKLILSAKEASILSGIGVNRMEAILRDTNCPFRIRKGKQIYVKRKGFEKYLEQVNEI